MSGGENVTFYDDEEPTVDPDGPVDGGVERVSPQFGEQYGAGRFARAFVWCAGPTYGETAPVGTWTLLQGLGVAGLISTMIVALCATIICGFAGVGPVWAAVGVFAVAALYFWYRRLMMATVASYVFARSRRTGSHLLCASVATLVSVLGAATASWVFGMAVFQQEIRDQVTVDTVTQQRDDMIEWSRTREANRGAAESMYAAQLAQPERTRNGLQARAAALQLSETNARQNLICEVTPSFSCPVGTGDPGMGSMAMSASDELSDAVAQRTSADQRLAEYTVFAVPAPFDSAQLATCGYSTQTTELTPYDSERCQGILLVKSRADQLTPGPPSARSSDGLLPKIEAFDYLRNSENASAVRVVVVALFFVLIAVDYVPLWLLLQSRRRP